MVPSYQRDPIRIPHLQTQQQQKALQRIEAAVHKVAHEQVVGVRDVAAHAKQFHQVVELAVDVAAYCDGGVDGDDVAFFDEQFTGFVAEFADLGFGDRAAGA